MAVADTVLGSATHGFAVVKSDVNDLEQRSRALYVGTGGNLALVLASGAAVTFKNVADGSVLDVRATRVMSTGTTAADIIALV